MEYLSITGRHVEPLGSPDRDYLGWWWLVYGVIKLSEALFRQQWIAVSVWTLFIFGALVIGRWGQRNRPTSQKVAFTLMVVAAGFLIFAPGVSMTWRVTGLAVGAVPFVIDVLLALRNTRQPASPA